MPILVTKGQHCGKDGLPLPNQGAQMFWPYASRGEDIAGSARAGLKCTRHE